MKFLSNEKGQMMILFAVGFAMFCGLAGLTIDVGDMYWQKTKLQRALDAACLAGAQELPDTSGADEAKLREYAALNGISSTELTSIDKPSTITIRAKATRSVRLFLIPVLGFGQYANVSAESAATKKVDSVFNYLMFSGSPDDPMDLAGLNGHLTGSVHSNEDINLDFNNVIEITGATEAVGVVSWEAHRPEIANPIDGADSLPMPDYSERILAEVMADGGANYYLGDQNWTDINRVNVSEPIYVDGNLTLQPNSIRGPGALVVNGDLYIDTNNIHSWDPIFIYATGNIYITSNNVMAAGIIYAPNGTLTIGPDADGHASNVINTTGAQFIANVIDIDGTINNITMDGVDNSSVLQYGSVSLIPY